MTLTLLVQGSQFENCCGRQPLEVFKFGKKIIRFAFFCRPLWAMNGKGMSSRQDKRGLNEMVLERGREGKRKSSYEVSF